MNTLIKCRLLIFLLLTFTYSSNQCRASLENQQETKPVISSNDHMPKGYQDGFKEHEGKSIKGEEMYKETLESVNILEESINNNKNQEESKNEELDTDDKEKKDQKNLEIVQKLISEKKSVYVLLHDENWNCLIARKRFVYRKTKRQRKEQKNRAAQLRKEGKEEEAEYMDKRSKRIFEYVNQAGQWVIPGGKIEAKDKCKTVNRTIIKAAEREFKEETGFCLKGNIRLFFEKGKNKYRIENSPDIPYILVLVKLNSKRTLLDIQVKINKDLRNPELYKGKNPLHQELRDTKVLPAEESLCKYLGISLGLNEKLYNKDKNFVMKLRKSNGYNAYVEKQKSEELDRLVSKKNHYKLNSIAQKIEWFPQMVNLIL